MFYSKQITIIIINLISATVVFFISVLVTNSRFYFNNLIIILFLFIDIVIKFMTFGVILLLYFYNLY
jgi:hypothetical protein